MSWCSTKQNYKDNVMLHVKMQLKFVEKKIKSIFWIHFLLNFLIFKNNFGSELYYL